MVRARRGESQRERERKGNFRAASFFSFPFFQTKGIGSRRRLTLEHHLIIYRRQCESSVIGLPFRYPESMKRARKTRPPPIDSTSFQASGESLSTTCFRSSLSFIFLFFLLLLLPFPLILERCGSSRAPSFLSQFSRWNFKVSSRNLQDFEVRAIMEVPAAVFHSGTFG